MKFKYPMLVVTDIDRSVEFYKKIFGLHVIMDFGANKTLTGGLALQTAETYKDFIGTNDISFGGNNFELYFEEDDFDKFASKNDAGTGRRTDECTYEICKCLYEINRYLHLQSMFIDGMESQKQRRSFNELRRCCFYNSFLIITVKSSFIRSVCSVRYR